jgi:hypothetical protein
MWQRWNGTTRIFEKSSDNGVVWTPLGLDASIITQGVIQIIRADGVADNVYVGDFRNLETTSGRSFGLYIQAGVDSTDSALYIRGVNGTDRFRIRGDGAIIAATVANSSWAMTIENNGSSDNHGLYINVKAGSTGIPLRVDKGSSPIFTITNAGVLEFSGVSTGYLASFYLDGAGLRFTHNSPVRAIQMVAYSGGVILNPSSTAWAAISDERQKNITGLIEKAIEKLNSLRPVLFTFKKDEKTRHVGLIAQDVQRVLPEAVSVDAEDMLSLRYTEVIPLLVAGLQELAKKVERLEA